MSRAERRRAAKAGLRNLTAPELKQLNDLLAPHIQAEAQAVELKQAVGRGYLAALGFPPNVSVKLDTGVVSFLSPGPAPTSPNGVKEEAPAEAPEGVG